MSARLSLSDLPPKLRAEAERQLTGISHAIRSGPACSENGILGMSDAEIARKTQRKRLRQSSKGPNKLEASFRSYLTANWPEAQNIRFNAISFEIASGLRYKPDFTANNDGSWIAWEVKGPWASRDSFPRLKMAARVYPEIAWYLAYLNRDKDWIIELVEA